MNEDPVGRLVASAQGGLADLPTVQDYRAKRVLTDSAAVQARCAQALAIQELAVAVGRLVDALTTEEKP